jgi:polyvinyl alcohol dehydrogenase (cytochrome)
MGFHFLQVKKLIGAALACALLATAPVARALETPIPDGQWTMGGQNMNNWRNQIVATINPQNVVGLTQKWVFTTRGDVSATPAVANGIVYFPDLTGMFYAVSADTGALIWSHMVSDWTGVAGDSARNNPLVIGNMLIFGNQAGTLATWDGTTVTGPGASIVAVNAQDGQPIWVSKIDSSPTAIVTSSPVVFNNVVYVGVASAEENLATILGFPCCVFRGSVVALDLSTGRVLWQTFTVPPNNGAVGGYSGGSIWSSTPVVDPARNSLYIGTGNNYSVPASVSACFANDPTNKFCTDLTDYFDTVLSLDLTTGAVKWANRAVSYDAWNVNCGVAFPAGSAVPGPNCPVPSGQDFDFGGAGANFYAIFDANGVPHDVLGIGEKSGIYWAFNPDDGTTLWSTQVGPGSSIGGIQWGTATDGWRIFVPNSNFLFQTTALQPSQAPINGGSWTALNPVSGQILWQTPTPGLCSPAVAGVAQGCMALGPTSVAGSAALSGSVVFAGSMDSNPANPTMFALDATTGAILWSFASGSSVNAGPAIVGNSIYWGSGYSKLGAATGTSNTKLFAFSVPQ